MLYNVFLKTKSNTYVEFGISNETAQQISDAITRGDSYFDCEGTRMDLTYWDKFKIFDNSKMSETLALLRKSTLALEGRKRKILYPDPKTHELDILMDMGNDVTVEFKNSSRKNENVDRWLYIHSTIQRVAKKKFDDGHYADAVESAFKEINDLVKKEYKSKARVEDDGDSLMRKAFSVKSPAFKLADITTDSGRNIQQGYMDIFAGSMKGIRNPKAHANLNVHPDEAWEKIVLASHLLRMWEGRVNF